MRHVATTIAVRAKHANVNTKISKLKRQSEIDFGVLEDLELRKTCSHVIDDAYLSCLISQLLLRKRRLGQEKRLLVPQHYARSLTHVAVHSELQLSVKCMSFCSLEMQP